MPEAGEHAPLEVTEDLRRTALSFAQAERLELEPEARAALDEAISSAAQRIAAEGKAADQEAIRTAEQQVRKLIALAAPRKSFAETDEPSTVNREHLTGALSRLCPGFWPFC